MGRLSGTSFLAGVVLLALSLAIGIAGCSLGGCATALATGILAAQGEELVLLAESGEVLRVDWPDGYGTSTDAAGRLVLTHVLGGIVARQGDTVNVGGGFGDDDAVFDGCGDVWVSETSLS